MQEQMERLLAWAKEHPWLAAIIVGGVILLGYIAYRRSAGGGGSGELFAPAEPSQPSDETAGFGAGGGGSANGLGLPSPATSGGEVTTPLEAAIPAPVEPFQFSAPDVSEAFSGLGVTSPQDIAGYASPTSVEPTSYTPMTEALSAAAPSPAKGIRPISGLAPLFATMGATAARDVAPIAVTTARAVTPTAVQAAGLPIVTNTIRTALNTLQNIIQPKPIALGRAGARIATAGGTRVPSTPQTPAAKLGLPAYFSGWYRYSYYFNGFPAMAPSGSMPSWYQPIVVSAIATGRGR